MELKISELWVVISRGDQWSEPNMHSDVVYSDRAEADTQAGISNGYALKSRPHYYEKYKVNPYYVETLDDWLDQCVRNGENRESDRNRSSY